MRLLHQFKDMAQHEAAVLAASSGCEGPDQSRDVPMRLRSLLRVPGRSLVSAAVLKASASFWGLRPVEKEEVACGMPAQGEAAAVTAAMRLESLANGSFSAERAAHLHQCQPSRLLGRQVSFSRLHTQAPATRNAYPRLFLDTYMLPAQHAGSLSRALTMAPGSCMRAA